MTKRVLAFDFGASSGRAVIGTLEEGKITLKEIHRFSNDPVLVGDTFYWDILRLFHEIKQGLVKAKLDGGFDSIGIDTWGVDFGLIGKDGKLLENPVHYRDKRNIGMAKESEKYISKEHLYKLTGIQFMDFNTVFQLLSLKLHRPELLERAEKLLFIPDLFAYFLTGNCVCEYSIATTSQLIDINTQNWSTEITEKLGLPSRILGKIVPSGSVTGMLSNSICEELGLSPVPVTAVCGHDTQSAITAIPSLSEDFAFISSGTWSLFGTEIKTPIVDERSFAFNVTNEGGFGYSTAFLKNICGLWLIQESRRQWIREGKEYSYAELEKMALAEKPFSCFIDPDAPEFASPGDIPGKIREYCRLTGQHVPQNVGETVRCIYESLAMKYRWVLEGIENCTGKKYHHINIVGGGTKDTLLCQMTSHACAVPVFAGPVEATVMGNVAVQLISANGISDVSHARKIIAESENLREYKPSDTDSWNSAYERWCNITALSKN